MGTTETIEKNITPISSDYDIHDDSEPNNLPDHEVIIRRHMQDWECPVRVKGREEIEDVVGQDVESDASEYEEESEGVMGLCKDKNLEVGEYHNHCEYQHPGRIHEAHLSISPDIIFLEDVTSSVYWQLTRKKKNNT